MAFTSWGYATEGLLKFIVGSAGSFQRSAGIACRALAEPPTITCNPDVADDVDVRRAEWSECLINDPSTKSSGSSSLRVETWILRATDFVHFERFLKIRGFQNVGQLATMTCRERNIDPEMRCAECVRVLRGGLYGSLGVAVAAYPPQPDAIGCLALSKLIDMPPPGTEEDDSGDWDGDQGRQTAFCNSVNARFANVNA